MDENERIGVGQVRCYMTEYISLINLNPVVKS